MATVYATGKRKTAIAKVWVAPGSGKMVVNGIHLKKKIMLIYVKDWHNQLLQSKDNSPLYWEWEVLWITHLKKTI